MMIEGQKFYLGTMDMNWPERDEIDRERGRCRNFGSSDARPPARSLPAKETAHLWAIHCADVCAELQATRSNNTRSLFLTNTGVASRQT